jgi:hypothetical protein
MLGLAMVVLPNQPLIYVTITIGMLIEFPHLIALKVILLKRLKNQKTQPSITKKRQENCPTPIQKGTHK